MSELIELLSTCGKRGSRSIYKGGIMRISMNPLCSNLEGKQLDSLLITKPFICYR